VPAHRLEEEVDNVDNIDSAKSLVQEIAPTSPGFLLEPTQFGLAGEVEDFVECVDW
jgi:hypothetical protein